MGITQTIDAAALKKLTDHEKGKCTKCGHKDGDATLRMVGAFGFIFTVFWVAGLLPVVNAKVHEHAVAATDGWLAVVIDNITHLWPAAILLGSLGLLSPKLLDRLLIFIASFRRKRNGGT